MASAQDRSSYHVTNDYANTAVLILFGNSAASIPGSYKRYLVNGLREAFGLIGVPIRLSMRSGSENPYAPKRRRS